MAVVDSERDLLVLRIVYDGPAMSGKTTSLRTLADGWDIEVTTPEEEEGRTLFFDWVDYVGGLFDGRQIRCQLVGVPGQRELSARRALLLREADAVVFVADSREEFVAEGVERFRELLDELKNRNPHVGVVLQANKRDAPTAVPREELMSALEDVSGVAVLESIATSGLGIREAFVFAVRLALDRVRELGRLGLLEEVSKLEEDSAEDLLSAMQQETAGLSLRSQASQQDIDGIEASILESARAQAGNALVTADDAISRLLASSHGEKHRRNEREVSSAKPLSESDEYVFSPDPMMPGGCIWPPVDGRALLHEVSQLAIQPERTARGDWWASGGGWRFHSHSKAAYDSPDEARHALISWSRLHAAKLSSLSSGRTVILAAAGPEKLRIWQLVRVERSLREHLAMIDLDEEPERVADEVVWTAARLLDARADFTAGGVELPCTLWTVGCKSEVPPAYVGLMPFHDQEPVEVPTGSQLLQREFEPVIRDWKRERKDYDDVMRALDARLSDDVSDAKHAPVSEWIRATVGPLCTRL